MGLTSIPTEVDGSLGRTKVNRFNPPNLDEYPSAIEYNAMKKAVAEMAAALGLGDGSTAGSIEQKMRAISDVLVGTGSSFRLFDDFEHGLVTVRWNTGGAAAITSGQSRNEVGAGIGLLKIACAASQNGVINWNPTSILTIKHLTSVYRARVLFDSTANLSDVLFGFYDGANTFALFRKATTTGWKVEARSTAGGVTTSVDNLGSALAANTWYDLRIESSATSHKFYVNDVLLTTITASGSLFQGSDVYGFSASFTATGGGALNGFVDFVDVRGVRA